MILEVEFFKWTGVETQRLEHELIFEGRGRTQGMFLEIDTMGLQRIAEVNQSLKLNKKKLVDSEICSRPRESKLLKVSRLQSSTYIFKHDICIR